MALSSEEGLRDWVKTTFSELNKERRGKATTTFLDRCCARSCLPPCAHGLMSFGPVLPSGAFLRWHPIKRIMSRRRATAQGGGHLAERRAVPDRHRQTYRWRPAVGHLLGQRLRGLAIRALCGPGRRRCCGIPGVQLPLFQGRRGALVQAPRGHAPLARAAGEHASRSPARDVLCRYQR